MQDTRKRTIFLCAFSLMILTSMLVLFFSSKQDIAGSKEIDTTQNKTIGIQRTLQEVLNKYIPSETVHLQIDQDNIIHLSAEFSKENLKELSARYDVPINYLIPLLPDLITGILELKFERTENGVDVSILKFEIAEIDLTDLLGNELSEAISRAVNNGVDSIGFHRQFS